MIVLEIVQIVVLGLVGLKVVWNLLVPYALAWQLLKSGAERSESTSVMPYVEIGLVCIAVLIAAIIPGSKWFQSAGKVAWIGFGLIAASFIHLIVIGMLAGALASALDKRRKGRKGAGEGPEV